MKFSLSWLKEYIDVSATCEVFVHRLTMAGLEVEKVERVGKETVLELEITPNRPDCLSLTGLAREVSAIFDKAWQPPKSSVPPYPKKMCNVSIEAEDGCWRYVGTVIEGVSVKAAPKEMQGHLKAIGLRSINNIVDITNFCLMEGGQPLHAFDADCLEGRQIIVRYARKGEKIITLDGIERDLDPSILVIADAKKPVAIAGIMGGLGTEVTAATKNILLESAYFKPTLIRATARRLGLSSDSSYRFERGVDYMQVAQGAQRATYCLLAMAGGAVTQYKDLRGVYKPAARKRVTITPEQITDALGVKISAVRCRNICKRLGCEATVTATGALVISPPSFRQDIKAPVDIVEEIVRIIGFDAVPASFPVVKPSTLETSSSWQRRRVLAKDLRAQGLNEIITYTMINEVQLARTGLETLKGVTIRNPLSQEYTLLRSTLLPSFLATVSVNRNRGQRDLRIFETGKVYSSNGEHETLGLLMTGEAPFDWRRGQLGAYDFYDLKGCLERMLKRGGYQGWRWMPANESYLEEGTSAALYFGKQQLGVLGTVKTAILEAWNIKPPLVHFAQINLERLYQLSLVQVKYKAIIDYPLVVRDISLSVALSVSFVDIKNIIKECAPKFLTDVRFTEEYRGDKIASGQRGLVFSLYYQSATGTLREEEVATAHQKILQALCSRLGAVQR